MSYQDERLNSIQAEIERLNNIKRGLRERERSLDARMQYLANPPTFPANSVKTLKDAMLGALPNYMMPGNVGGLNEVCWPFYFNVDIDLGDEPTISPNSYSSSFFQVDQEAGFLLMSISRTHSTNAAGQSATINAPIQVDLIDRQSTRRFSSEPIPLQMFGINSKATIFPTAYYMQPNAFLDIKVNGMFPFEQSINGSGKFQLSFFGYRIRTEDAGKVLSTIFVPQN